MLIDCFPYFNERELLELRINVLKDHVDGFLIADADRTHRGEPKPYSCVDTIKELGLPSDLIEVVHVQLPSTEVAVDPWARERGQRDALGQILKQLPSDTVFICSDCDEIPNPNKFDLLKKQLIDSPDQIFGLEMSMHYGRADLQLCSPTGELFRWPCATVCTVDKLNQLGSITSVRAQPNRNFIGSRDGGWHLSWMGDNKTRKQKLRSIAEFYIWDTPEVQSICDTFNPQEGMTDMLGRKDHILTPYSIGDLPQEAVKLERVKKHLLPDG
jgi:beta-1,4-mannosyl-glycoprotein beta-1,4-N-acetylglucosaminyltransferase